MPVKAVSGSIWYRISADERAHRVRALYGVSYLYAARGLFASIPALTRYALCAVNLRTTASLTGTVLKVLPTGGKVTVTATTAGPSYQTTCSDRAVSRLVVVPDQRDQRDERQDAVRRLVPSAAAAGLFGSTAPGRAAPPTATPDADSKPTPTRPDPDPGADRRPTPTPIASAVLEGIDVSHWQNAIDWTKVAAAGKKFVFMKATESTNFLDGNYVSTGPAPRPPD